MSVELNQEQQQVLDRPGETPLRLVDPRTHAAYVLVPESEYEAMRELLDELRQEEGIHAVGLRNAANRFDET